MSRFTLALAALSIVAGGCASSNRAPAALAPSASQPAVAAVDPFEPVARFSAAGLAFSAPIAAGNGALDLSRNNRTPAAFIGYEEPSVTFSCIRIDDRQDDARGNWYQRRAISERTGVLYR